MPLDNFNLYCDKITACAFALAPRTKAKQGVSLGPPMLAVLGTFITPVLRLCFSDDDGENNDIKGKVCLHSQNKNMGNLANTRKLANLVTLTPTAS